MKNNSKQAKITDNDLSKVSGGYTQTDLLNLQIYRKSLVQQGYVPGSQPFNAAVTAYAKANGFI